MHHHLFYKLVGAGFLLVLISIPFFVFSQIFGEFGIENEIDFEVKKGESVAAFSQRLEEEGIVKSAWWFRKYIAFKGFDRDVHAGEFGLEPPVTIARVVEALRQSSERGELEITILPGWDLRDIADYLVKRDLASEKDFYSLVGKPAVRPTKTSLAGFGLSPDIDILQDKPNNLSYEGYLAADTFRIFSDAELAEIVIKLIKHQDSLITEKMYSDIKAAKRSVHEIMTMASIVEREAKSATDKAKMADIFWRRFDAGMGLQADSTVHYVAARKGDVFTKKEEREIDSPWNTYKYAGLPPGPIAIPGTDSIRAAIYPEPNDYWYFLTTFEGEVKYAKTNEEHNLNRQRYLR